MAHEHRWRHIYEDSGEDYDKYDCNCGSQATAYLDKTTRRPVIIEAVDQAGRRFPIELKDLKKDEVAHRNISVESVEYIRD